LAIDRRAKACRDAFSHHLHHSTHRRALLANAVEIILEERGLLCIGAEEWIAVDLLPVPALAVDLVRAYLHQSGADRYSRQHLARHSSGRHPHRGLAGRGTPAAAIIAEAVFHIVGEIG